MLTPEQNAKINSITDQTMMLAALTGNDTPQVQAIVEMALTVAMSRPDFTPKYGPVEIRNYDVEVCNYDLPKKDREYHCP